MGWLGPMLLTVLAFWVTEGVAQRTPVLTAEDMERLGVIDEADLIHQLRDAITESEMAMTREAMGIGVGGGFLESRVLSFSAWRRYADDGTFNLEGALWETPVFAQGRLCVVARHGVVGESGESGESGYLWSRKLFETTFNWTAETEEECRLNDPFQSTPPQLTDAVRTNDIIPTDAMIEIVEGAERLTQAMLEHPAAASYRFEESDWRLTGVSLATTLRPGIGIAYHAWFDAGKGFGPAITFTVSDGVFVVHSIGSWVA